MIAIQNSGKKKKNDPSKDFLSLKINIFYSFSQVENSWKFSSVGGGDLNTVYAAQSSPV